MAQVWPVPAETLQAMGVVEAETRLRIMAENELEKRFAVVYSKFKLHFYQETFARFQNREASLTTVEAFAMEAIYALGSPTVKEFADFMRVSSSNAAYKIASLVRKGYVEKVQSEGDGREYHLMPTQKYLDYYNISSDYMRTVMGRLRERLTPDQLDGLSDLLKMMSDLMTEVALPGEGEGVAGDE